MSAALIEAARAALEALLLESTSPPIPETAAAIADLRTALAAAEQPAKPAPHAMQQLTAALKADPDYAWSWHCNLAMPVMDATGVTHRAANEAGARLMRHLFDIDITKHPHYSVKAESPAAPAQAAEDCERRPYGDLRNAKWLDPECYAKGACQSLLFKAAAEQPLTDEQLLAIARNEASGTSVKLTRDVGPYEVTEPTHVYRCIARAIEVAHGIGSKA